MTGEPYVREFYQPLTRARFQRERLLFPFNIFTAPLTGVLTRPQRLVHCLPQRRYRHFFGLSVRGDRGRETSD